MKIDSFGPRKVATGPTGSQAEMALGSEREGSCCHCVCGLFESFFLSVFFFPQFFTPGTSRALHVGGRNGPDATGVRGEALPSRGSVSLESSLCWFVPFFTFSFVCSSVKDASVSSVEKEEGGIPSF